MGYPVPSNFRIPTDIRQYDGTTDPQEHLDIYRTRMLLNGTADPIRCKAFPLTLQKSALTWFNQLPPRSVHRFSDLSSHFLAQFTTSRTKAKSVTSLLGFRQSVGESLRDYLDRFNQEALKIRDLTPQTALITLIGGLRPGDFQRSLAKKEPRTLEELQSRAEKYINLEEALKTADKMEAIQASPRREERTRREVRVPKDGRFIDCTPLRVSLAQIFREVHATGNLPRPAPLRTTHNTDKTLYCEYHRSHGHRTEDCRDLRDAVEELIRSGKLARYVASQRSPKRRRITPEKQERRGPARPPDNRAPRENNRRREEGARGEDQ